MKKSTSFLIFISSLLFVINPFFLNAQKKGKEVKEEQAVSKYEMANAEYLMIEAQKFFLLEDYDRATAFLEKSLEVDAKNHAAYFKMAEINYNLGKYNKGLIVIKQAQSLEPTNKFYYLLAAQLYKMEDDLLSAANEYETMIKQSKDYRDYLLDLADVYVAIENYEKAIQTLELTEEKFNTPNKFASQKKELYLKSGNDKKAIELMKSIVGQFPENEAYRLEYFDLLTALGKTKEAEALINTNEGSQLSNIKKLNLQIEAGEINQSKTEIVKAFSLPNVDVKSKLSILDKLVKTQTFSVQSLFIDSLQQELIKQYPNSVEVLKSSGDIYAALAAQANLEKKPIYEKAELTALKKLKDLNPADYQVWEKLLKRSFDQKSWETLLSDSEDALSYFPNQGLFYYYFGNAQLYSSKGDKEEAISAFNQAERLSRNDSELQSKIISSKTLVTNNSISKIGTQGEIRSTESETEINLPILKSQTVALEELNEMLARYVSFKNDAAVSAQILKKVDDLILRYPGEQELYLTKAQILFQINSFAEAKSTLDQTYSVNFSKDAKTDNGMALELYGDILYKLNQVEEAVEEWKKAKKFGNTSDKIDQKIADKKYYK